MQAKKILISARVDKETKDWIEKHPLSQSDLINYGWYLIRAMESNLERSKGFHHRAFRGTKREGNTSVLK